MARFCLRSGGLNRECGVDVVVFVIQDHDLDNVNGTTRYAELNVSIGGLKCASWRLRNNLGFTHALPGDSVHAVNLVPPATPFSPPSHDVVFHSSSPSLSLQGRCYCCCCRYRPLFCSCVIAYIDDATTARRGTPDGDLAARTSLCYKARLSGSAPCSVREGRRGGGGDGEKGAERSEGVTLRDSLRGLALV